MTRRRTDPAGYVCGLPLPCDVFFVLVRCDTSHTESSFGGILGHYYLLEFTGYTDVSTRKSGCLPQISRKARQTRCQWVGVTSNLRVFLFYFLRLLVVIVASRLVVLNSSRTENRAFRTETLLGFSVDSFPRWYGGVVCNQRACTPIDG